MKTTFLPLIAAALIMVARAADGIPATSVQLAAERLAVENARTAARHDDAVTAEQLLTSINRAQPDTSWWHLETAQRLIQLAHDVPREGPRGNAIPLIVSSALQHLTAAENLTADTRHKASIKSFAGLIQERFLGNHAAALASYQAAANLAGDNMIAVENAARLQRLAENQAARTNK